jgi:hypothetical protein
LAREWFRNFLLGIRGRYSAHPRLHPRNTGITEMNRGGRLLFASDPAAPLQHWQLHPIYQDPAEITASEGAINFHVRARTNDEWAFIHLDPSAYVFTNMVWEADIRRQTPFQEFAFNFRYRDMGNRYRYSLEDGRLYFDKAVGGHWYANIANVPFDMKLGQWYHLRIVTWQYAFRCYIDEKLLIENVDTDITSGSIAIILWEPDGGTDMVASVRNLVVLEYEPETAAT